VAAAVCAVLEEYLFCQ